MKIVIASDSFKGSLSSIEVAESVEKGILDVLPSCNVVKVAVADGGEGTKEALCQTLGGKTVEIPVEDPIGRTINASYVILEDGITAVLEMSSASGLTLLTPSERNPMRTSTYGTGQLIADALARGCRRFLAGIGGSATNDGGMGMLEALGYRFLDDDGNELSGIGASLSKVCRIDDSRVLQAVHESEFIVACDVDSPLYGPDGAAYVFAPQKGADPEMVRALDDGLRHFAEVSSIYVNSFGNRLPDNLDDGEYLHVNGNVIQDMSSIPGAGAAGGLGYAFVTFLGARLKRGVDMVLDAIGFDKMIEGADLVITGEGRIDAQTLTGKTPYGVLQRASRQGIPVMALAGLVDLDDSSGFTAIRQITPPDMRLSEAMLPAVASANLRRTISALLQQIQIT
jgi:glycerate kinase